MSRVTLLRLQLWALIAGFAVNLVALGYLIYVHEPIAEDNTFVLANILDDQNWTPDGYGRVTSILQQLPALWAHLLGAPVSFVIRIYEVSVVFHPFLSLAFCFWLLRKRNRLDLFIFPILSFATGYQAGLALTISSTLIAHNIFWPAWLFFVTGKKVRSADYVVMFSLFLAMALSHEFLIGNYILFAATGFHFFRTRKKDRNYYGFVGSLSVLLVVYVAFRVLILPGLLTPEILMKYHGGEFHADVPLLALKRTIISFRDSFPKLVIGGTALILAGALLLKEKSPWKKYVLIVLPLIPLIYFTIWQNARYYDARNARVWVLPVAAVLAALCLFQNIFLTKQRLFLTAASFLFVGAVRNATIAHNWAKGAEVLMQQTAGVTGCIQIPEEKVKFMDKWGARAWTLPMLSILYQMSDDPVAVAVPITDATHEPPCESVKKGFLDLGFLGMRDKRNGYFRILRGD